MTDGIGFIIGDVSRLLRRAFDIRAQRVGVNRTQWRMLTTLARNEGVNQSRLAELLDVEPITLCRMVDRLCEAGLVERRSDPHDRRAWLIHLNQDARPILAELRLLGDGLLDEALAGLSATERGQLVRLLERMRDNLTHAEKEARKTHHG